VAFDGLEHPVRIRLGRTPVAERDAQRVRPAQTVGVMKASPDAAISRAGAWTRS
jgi:hypothetical protein